MTKIIYFDYCALIIEVLILMSSVIRKLTRGRVNRWYITTIITLIVATVSDIVGMLSEVQGADYIFVTYVANLICLWATATLGTAICGYLFAKTGIWYLLQKSRTFLWIFYTPFIINSFIIFFINPFNRMIFYIDGDGIYRRGDMISILYVLAFVYVYIGGCIVFKYRKIYSFRKIVSIFLLLGSSIIAAVIQIFFPNVIVQMYVAACATLILLFEVQVPEERIHAGTGRYSLNAYVQDVKNMFYTGMEFSVTIVAITNYNALVEMLGYFKAMNLINTVTKRMDRFIRENRIEATIYYLDGGRFAIVSDFRFSDRTYELSQGINGIMLNEVKVGDTNVKLLANVCVINCPNDVDDPDFLVAADENLMNEVYTGELRYAEKLLDRRLFDIHRDFTKIIDRAFDKKYIELNYQPIYSTTDNRFVGVEAFLRVNDPEYGYISPDLIIREAEKNSAIHAITTFEIEEACAFLAESSFLFAGLDFVEINLSPIQCMWTDLTNVLLAIVRTYNIQPKKLCLNITDIDNIDVYSKMKSNLHSLAQVGFNIVMDDFGAGIFEIERIVEMPLAGIKLDRSFIKNGFTRENMSVLKGTIRMIKDIGIYAAAVGVEDKEMLKELEALGCTRMQGYYYCKPLNKTDLMKFLLVE